MADRFDWISRELGRLEDEGVVRRRRVVATGGGECEIGGRRLKCFAGNDYLDLAHDPRVIEAAKRAVAAAGTGSGASALVTGRSEWHARLEEDLAAFEGEESAVLFPTGYAANLGTITALAGRDDALYSDRLNHASLIDGCRLSGAAIHIYDHDRLDLLEEELSEGARFRRRFIVTDSLFSMDGVAAPLRELCELAERHGAELIIDEAHATGVFGPLGRGLAEELGLSARVAVRVGTLSKGVGSLGGFVAGPRVLTDWLWNRARSQMFSTALPPASCAAASAAIGIIRQEPERRARLRELAERLRTQLVERGLPVRPGGVGPVVPILLGQPDAALAAAARLEEEGFLVAAIRPPTVAPGTSRLRITLCSAHTFDDVDQLAAALGEICGEPHDASSASARPSGAGSRAGRGGGDRSRNLRT